jgi:hypothetical protein
MASIAGMLPAEVIALRDGTQVHIPAKDLVTGDIVSFPLRVSGVLVLTGGTGVCRFGQQSKSIFK